MSREKLDRLMTRVGSSTNGSTSNDRTNYFSMGPSSLLPTLLWLDADRLDESHDHAAAFYPDDLRCWEYHDAVSPHSLVRLDPINISKVAA